MGTLHAWRQGWLGGPAEDVRLTDLPAPLDLNAATPEALEGLPGVGKGLAGSIVERRDEIGGFDRLEDLLAVPGIGPGLLNEIRSMVTVGEKRGKPDAAEETSSEDC